MNHDLIRSLIDNSTQHLSGWDELRGNYKESYVDRYKLVENVVRECARVSSNNPFQDGYFHARDLLAHFGFDEEEK